MAGAKAPTIIIINILMSQPKQRYYYDEYRNSNVNQDSYQRDRSRQGSERGIERRKIFGFEIFIDNDILNELGNLDAFFNSVKEEGGAERIRFNPDLTIPDLNGRNLEVTVGLRSKIYDRSMESKYECCRILLSHVYQKSRRSKSEPFEVIIFVPEGMVSLLIGTRGHQINKIMKESGTVIIVNQPINRMTYRTVKIQGHHGNIARACRIIYEILEEKSTIAHTIEKEPNPLDYTKSKVSIKLVLSVGVINYLQNKKKKFIKTVEEETLCTITFKSERNNKLLKRDEDMCIIIGKLEDVQAFIILLLTIVNNYYIDEKEGEGYTLKMLIPSNYVTKLIGQKGYMIKGITDKSGALIKIQSDRQPDTRECIIAIVGTREHKIDAICLILEQIECFKNGGPILQSGRSINENLAQQYKNSIPLRSYSMDEGDKQKEKDKGVFDEMLFKDIEEYMRRDDSLEDPKTKEMITYDSERRKDRSEDKVTPEIQVKKVVEPDSKHIQKELKESKEESESEVKLEMGQIKKTPSKNRKRSSSSSHSSPNSRSQSKSRSRSKRRRAEKRQLTSVQRRKRSVSNEPYTRGEKSTTLKMVVPRKLFTDHKQLRYIEQLSNCQIVKSEYRLDSDEGILILKGTIKANNECARLLMKRLARYRADKK